MKRTLLVFLLVNLVLSACAPASAPTPTPAPSATPLPTTTATPTSTPTATPTATPMPIPTIQVGNLSVPDPRVTNPELFDLRKPDAPIPQFVNAMKMAGIEITAEQVAQGITYEALKDKEGNPFVVAVYNLAPSLFPEQYRDLAGPIPLMIAEKGEKGWEWKEMWLRSLADANGLTLEAPMISSDRNVEKIANQLLLTGETDVSIIFKQFTQNHWRKIIDDWMNIKTQLDTGTIPEGFPYNWSLANNALDYARSHNMTVRAQHLLWGGDVLDSIFNGGFTREEIKMIAEFIVKTRVLQYNGIANPKNPNKDIRRVINQWDIADEWAATVTYPHDKWPFWLTNLGFPNAIADVSRWVTEANPNAEQVIIEDAMLYLPSDRTDWRDKFMALLNYVKRNNIPVSRVGIENNFSVFNPPPESVQEVNLKTIMDMGFKTTSETTVVSGNDEGIWVYKRIKTPENPMLAQANIYGDNLQAYLNLGADQYGLGGISNASEWYIRAGINGANSMILDKNYQPTIAFYRLMQVLYQNLQQK